MKNNVIHALSRRPIIPLILTGFLALVSPATATPIIFSATESAKAGDYLGIQGTNFGTGSSVILTPVNSGGGLGTPVTLTAQNSSNAYLSAQMPAGTASGLFQLVARDSTGSQSTPTYVNRARITSYEFPEVDPGRQFRLFGRNLVLSGATPAVRFQDTVGGASTAGTVASGGTSYVVSVTTPASLIVGHTYQIYYLNGFGGATGEVAAPIAMAIRAGGTDSFSLGVPWGSDYSGFASNVYNVTSDPRLTIHALGNGTNDDTSAIQGAINTANAAGGGVVYCPTGTYALTSSLTLKSNVVIQGAGQTSTTFSFGVTAGAGISVASASSVMGVMNLTVLNTATITSSTFVFLLTAAVDTAKLFAYDVTFNGGDWATGGVWLSTTTGNRFLVTGCTIENLRRDGRAVQLKAYGGAPTTTQYVYFRNNTIPNFNIGLQLGSTNLIYENNTLNFDGTYYNYLIGTLDQTTAMYPGIQSDSGNQNRINLSGSYNVVLNNTFTHSGAAFVPQNDGENMLMEDPTGTFLNSTASSATATTLTDSTQSWATNAYANYNVIIVAGTGLGEQGTVTSNTSTTVTMTGSWPVVPDATSRYELCRFNVPHLLIDGNTIQNKNYFLSLFNGGYDVAIVNNTATNSLDMGLRALIQPGGIDSVMYDVLVADNTLTATTAARPSCIDAAVDEYYNPRFGSAAFLVEIRRNTVTALAGEAFRTVNTFQNASGQMFNLQGDSSPYGFEGILYDGNTSINATTAYGYVPGADGWGVFNYTDTGCYRDTFDMSQRDGTSVGTPTWNGNSITMNGTNYLNLSYYFAGSLANWGTLDLPGTMTIEGTFSTTGTNEGIISNRPLGDAAAQIDSTGKLSVYGAGFSGSIKSPHAVNDGLTHTFAWVSQPGEPSELLYLDGALVNSNSTYTPRAGTIGQGWIGSDVGNTTNFVGTLSGLRVWNTARTAAQVTADSSGLNFAGDEPGLVQLWRFDETSGIVAHSGILPEQLSDGLVDYWTYDDDAGTTVTDSVGGNNGTISGTASWTTGYFGYALSFDGSTNYVTVPPPVSGVPVWQGTNGLTVHARVNIASINSTWNYNNRYMLCAIDPSNTNAGWYLGTYANSSAPTSVGFVFTRGTSGSTPVSVYGTTNLVISQYYDVTITYVESTGLISLYVNGALQATQDNPRALQPSATALIMGMYGPEPTNTAHYFNGVIDDVKVYNRVLSATEVQQLDAH